MREESQIKQQLTWKKQQQIMKNLLRSCSIKFQPKFCGRQRTVFCYLGNILFKFRQNLNTLSKDLSTRFRNF